MLQGFQQQQTAALTDDEAVPVRVEGTRGLGGIVVSGGQGFQGIEAGYGQRRNGGFHSAADGGLAAPELDVRIGGADGV